MDTIEYLITKGLLDVQYRKKELNYKELKELVVSTNQSIQTTQICVFVNSNKRCKKKRHENSKYCIDHIQKKSPQNITGITQKPHFIDTIVINSKIYQIDQKNFLFYQNKCVGMYSPNQEPSHEFFYYPELITDFNPLFELHE